MVSSFQIGDFNMHKKENKVQSVTEEVWIGTVCDQCNEVIVRPDLPKWNNFHYYNVTTHHRDWGNDSIDSYEYLDFCSMKCLLTHMKKYFEEAEGTESYDIERMSQTRDPSVS